MARCPDSAAGECVGHHDAGGDEDQPEGGDEFGEAASKHGQRALGSRAGTEVPVSA